MPLKVLQIRSKFPSKVFETIDSTQIEARRQIGGELATPFWVLAFEQTQGRGRSGRNWQSDRGNYSSSLVYPMPSNRADAPKFSLITAWGLMLAFETLGIEDIQFKWPNDVLISGKKIAGILLEAEGEVLIIGTGVNLLLTPSQNLEKRAMTTMALSEVATTDFEGFHRIFEESLFFAIQQFETYGFDVVREALKDKLWARSGAIFDDGKEDVLVQLHEIGADGQLIVDQNGERREIYAGDLHALEANGTRN